MLRHLGLMAILIIGLTACAAADMPQDGVTGATLETFEHRVATSEMVLVWTCLQPEAGMLRVIGEAQNPWQAQPIAFLELQLVGVDAQDRQTGQAAGRARDIQIFTNQRSPFQLDLRTAGTEVRFDLYYRYQWHNEYDSSARLAGPVWVGPRFLAQTQTQQVRDVCSPTQHLAR